MPILGKHTRKMFKILDFESNRSKYGSLNLEYEKVFFDEKTGGFLAIHTYHGKYEKKQNAEIGMRLARKGLGVLLTENEDNKISADALINDEMWEFKTIAKANNLSNAVQRELLRGRKQAGCVLVCINQRFEYQEITKGIYNADKFDVAQLLKRIGLLLPDDRLIIIEREEVQQKVYIEKVLPQKKKKDREPPEPSSEW